MNNCPFCCCDRYHAVLDKLDRVKILLNIPPATLISDAKHLVDEAEGLVKELYIQLRDMNKTEYAKQR